MQNLIKQFQKNPVIPAARTLDGVKRASQTNAAAIFLLGGSILTLPDMIAIAHDCGNRA